MKKFLKIIGITIGIILFILLATALFLQTAPGKKIVRNAVVSFLEKKFQTPVVIDRIDYKIPTMVALEGVLFIDKNQDTLLSLQLLEVDIAMLALLKNELNIDDLYVKGLYARMHRSTLDTTYNYQYIIDAFVSVDKETKELKIEDTSATAMLFNIESVNLVDITFIMDDQAGGTYFDVILDSLYLAPKTIDPSNMVYKVKELYIQNTSSTLKTFPGNIPPSIDTSTDITPLILQAEKLQIVNTNYRMLTEPDSFHLDIYVGHLLGNLKDFDLAKSFIDIEALQLQKTDCIITMGHPTGTKVDAIENDTTSDTSSSPWRILAKSLQLDSINFKMDNNLVPYRGPGIDYSHLDITAFNMKGKDIVFTTNDTISGIVDHISLKEKSGLQVLDMHTNLLFNNTGVLLDSFLLRTNNTRLQDRILISYPSLATLSDDMSKLFMNVNLSNSTVGMNDILIFSPNSLRPNLLQYQGQSLQLAGNISGYLNDIELKQINISGLQQAKIALNGKLKGLPDANQLYYDLDIKEATVSYADIQPFVPKSVSENISIPSHISLSGNIQGSTTTYQPNLNIVTSEGNAHVRGRVNITNTGKESYDLDITTQSMNIGKILRQDSLMGYISMTGKVKGTSFDINKMNATVDGYVQRFDFNGYAYQDVNLDATIANQLAKIELNSNDPNAQVDLVADVDLRNKYPAVNSSIDLYNLDLKALNFFEDTLVLGGKLNLNFSDLNPDMPTGFLSWDNPFIQYNTDTVYLDSIVVRSTPTADTNQNIVVNIPEFLNMELTGRIPLTKIGNAALYHIDRYFDITDTLGETPGTYDMLLNLGLKNNIALRKFIPGLTTLDTLGLTSAITPNSFEIDVIAPKVVYNDMHINNLQFHIQDSLNNALGYRLTLDSFIKGNTLEVYTPTLSGFLRNDSLFTNLITHNIYGVENYEVSAYATTQDQTYFASLGSKLKLNYEDWQVTPNNLFAYNNGKFFVNNLGISKGNELISINSQQQSDYNSPIDINIKNFEIANITRILDPDSLIAEGILNATTTISFIDTFPLMTGDIIATQLKVYNTHLGTLKANVFNNNANTYSLTTSLTEHGNSINLKGDYHLSPINGNNLDFDLNLAALSLKSFEGMSFGHLSQSSGFLRGDLKIQGKVDAMKINGALRTDQLTTRINMINNKFSLPNERITFNNGTITFDNFNIIDTLGNKATITGNAQTNNYTDYNLDLKLNARNWLVMNSNKSHYELMYGRMILSSDVNVKGTATAPVLNGNIVIHDSTNFYYANVDDGPGISDYDGIVKFVDNIETYDPTKDTLNNKDIVVQNAMTMNLNIETEKHASFNVIVDPLTGDNLSVNGAAFLNASMMPGGSFNLAGVYQIEGGYYELNYELLKRKFLIEENSMIQLAGNPLDANINIVAAYESEVSPYDLVQNNVDAADLVYYKQRMPFKVLLKITGKPLQPIINFDIVLEEEGKQNVSKDVADVVETKLRNIRLDAAEMNKQVFAMLLFERFISDDPFQSGNAPTVEFYVRQSASRFLSQQLNNLANNFVNGVDLSIDVATAEDYSTGSKQNRTSLNLQASKNLFNDRLKVTLGNDFQIEGSQIPGRESSYIPGNISLDYKLTTDGKYTMRGYRKNQLQNVIDGFVVETGVAFRLNYEYNRFRQLFRNRRARMNRNRTNTESQPIQNTEKATGSISQ